MIRHSVAAALLAALLAGATPVGAEQETGSDSQATRQAVATLGLRVYEKLQQVNKLSQQGERSAALAILDKLKQRQANYNGHERARLWSAYAYLYYQQEDYDATARAYRQALAEQGMPQGLRNELLYSLAQVSFLQADYDASLQLVERWLKAVPEPGNEASIFVGQVYYQQQQYRKASRFAKRAVSAYQTQNKRVPEHWYLLLNASYYALQDYRNSFKVTLALLNAYPKKAYYGQLSALYGELGKDFEQFSIQQAMSDAGLLETAAERVGFSQFLLHNERPYQAAQLLNSGLEQQLIEGTEQHLKLLATAWMLAREHERALAPLTKAASLSEDGELYLQLAQAYVQLERWQQAIKALDKAQQRGGLKRADRAYLLAGMAHFNLEQFDAAIKHFKQAQQDKRSRKIAAQWLAYVKAEQQRQLSLL